MMNRTVFPEQDRGWCYQYPGKFPHLFASFSWLPSGSSASWDARLSLWAHFTLIKGHMNVFINSMLLMLINIY